VVNGNAFTENTVPGNESGFYAGLTYRPASSWRLDAYVDLFQFPWLKYAVDLPSAGSEFFIQVKYTPTKQLELLSRFRKEIKQANQTIDRMPMHAIVKTIKQNWRTHLDYKVNRHFSLRNRVELVWYNDHINKPQEGFLTFLDFLYKPMSRPYSLIARLQYFESAGYDARVYAYENDVMYIYNVPSFSGKGIRYYLVAGYDFSKNLSGWLKIGKTGTPEEKFNNLPAPAGTNIAGNTDIRVQLRYVFN
jgi:hypothetical protein